MKRKRKSSVATPSDRPRTFAEIRQTSAPREARWNRLYTQSVIRASQPDPYRRLIPAALQSFRPDPLGKSVRIHHGPRPVTQKWFLVDKRTGEVVQETHRRESIGTLEERRCREAKDDRRHFVIKSGYGGNNKATNYREWSEC